MGNKLVESKLRGKKRDWGWINNLLAQECTMTLIADRDGTGRSKEPAKEEGREGEKEGGDEGDTYLDEAAFGGRQRVVGCVGDLEIHGNSNGWIDPAHAPCIRPCEGEIKTGRR